MWINNYKSKNIVINQFMGLGDILFSIPIAEYFFNLGYNITWPINNEFLNIKKNFNYINFIDKNSLNINYESIDIVENENFLIIPLRFSNNLLNNGDPSTCMSDKYKYIDLDINMWKNLKWERDKPTENKLYYDILGLKDDEEYNLVNETYNMDKKISIDINNGLKTIQFKIIENFNILDWYKVIENATNIYTVGTSLIFLIEVIPTKKLNQYILYPRKPIENDCSYYNYLLDKVTKENN